MNAELDIGPLLWVKDEIDLALTRAAEALQALARSPGDTAKLDEARAHLHQAHGALAIVGLDGVTEFSSAIERLLNALAGGEAPWSEAAGATAQDGMLALRQYLDELIAGRSNQPLRLLPVYRRLGAARGVKEAAASDLFFPDLTQRPPRRDSEAAAVDEAALQTRLKAARLGFERGLMKWSRDDAGGVRDMRNSIAIIEALQIQPATRAFWWVTLAFFDALAGAGIADDENTRHLCGRIDAQVRKLLGGAEAVAERLMRDVLYCVAVSTVRNEHIDLVRAAYRLDELVPPSALDDPHAAVRREMLERIISANHSWDRFCAGVAAELPRFHEQSAQLVALAQKIGQVDLTRLAAAVANAANLLRKNPLTYNDEQGREVATALLLIEHALDQAPASDIANVEFAALADTVTGRFAALQRGETLPPPQQPLLAELAQRARQRQALQQTTRALRECLTGIERALDAFFRNPAAAGALVPLAQPLQEVAAMFTRLGRQRAVDVTWECARSVQAFAAPGYQVNPEAVPGEYEQVARKISALGFFVDRLQHGEADLDAILAPPRSAEFAASAELAAPSVEAELSQMARMTRTLVGALREAPQDETLRSQLKQNLEGVREDAHLVGDAAIEQQAAAALNELDALLDNTAAPERIEAIVAPLAARDAADAMLVTTDSMRLAAASASEVDDELLGIFVEEVLQLLDTIAVQFSRLRLDPAKIEHMAIVRRCFHTLKGSARMVGLKDFSEAAWAVEMAINRHLQTLQAASPALLEMIDTAQKIISDWVERLQRRASSPDTTPLLRQCEALKQSAGGAAAVDTTDAAPADAEEQRSPATEPAAAATPPGMLHADQELLSLFLEESRDLVTQAAAGFRHWRDGCASGDHSGAESLQRLLHTLKGSARMVGMTALGDAIHAVETRIAEALTTRTGLNVTPALIGELEAAFDHAVGELETVHVVAEAGETGDPAPHAPAPMLPMLRVRAELVDELVNESGEIAIARSRIEGGVKALRASLGDLADNVARLRSQLREIEMQAETRMQSRRSRTQEHEFDPLEMDRFTRLQELTRLMAESVNDVATVENNLRRDIDQADESLTQQARLSRELSQRLMSVRMVPFASIAERLRRVVRQTAQEDGKEAVLELRGGDTEIDRSVLERMTAPIEHLLRNAVVHGVEAAAERRAAGKPAQGAVVLSLAQEGNEVAINVSDDGAGLDYRRIRDEAVKRGLLGAEQNADEARLAQLIYQPGFTTARKLSAIAGRGVGMDAVRSEIIALGGRIEVRAQPGQGTTFVLHLPLTLAVIPVLLVRSAARTYAIPSAMVVQASEVKAEAMAGLRGAGVMEWQAQRYPLHDLQCLFRAAPSPHSTAQRCWVILLRGGEQRVALEVDELAGNEEVVVKNIGPQLARVAGISGATVLADGAVVLILNPIALAGRNAAAESMAAPRQIVAAASASAVPAAPPTVMVVDDSLTVRKITSRLLDRAGYRVILAKDGVDALEQLAAAATTLPDVMLADIEMPRMDGFDLVRHVRADARLKSLPVIMITSRIADKHRNYALELGVNHYLGKPYDEETLLKLIAEYVVK